MAEHIEKVARTVEDIYGMALVEMATQAGNLDDLAAEVEEFSALLNDQPDLLKLLGSRVLGEAKLAGSLEKILKGNVSDLLYNFIQTVNQKGRLEKLQLILKSFSRIVDTRHGIVEVDIYVALALEKDALDALAEKIGVAIERNVILNQKVDADLIGGLKLRVGDQLIDGSIVTQLKILERKIVAEGREKTKTNFAQLIAE